MVTTGLSAQSTIYGQPKTVSGANHDTLNAKLTNYSTFELHPLTLWSALHYSGKDTATIRLNTGDVITKIFLRRSSIFPSGAKMAIQESTGVVMRDMRDDGVYRGYVNDDTTQYATFIIKKNAFSGYYRLNGTTWQLDDIGSLVIGLLGDVSTIYTKYQHVLTPTIDCPSTFTDNSSDGDSLISGRENGLRYLEIAYEIDGEMYTDLGSEAAVQDYVVKLVIKMEPKFRAAYDGLRFSAIHINIWKDASTDPYSGTAVNRWTQVKNWWQNLANGKGCIQRDAVMLLSGSSGLSAHGFVADAGVASICGSALTGPCIWFPYSVVHYSSVLDFDANKAAHELGHNFGLGHRCTCGLMLAAEACINGQTYPSCPGENGKILLANFDTKGKIRIESYFNDVFQTCRPNIVSAGASDACMMDAPPVDLGFNLTLESNQVILTNSSVICPGGIFTASFYNTYDPYGSLTWTMGPYLVVDDNYPAASKERRIKLPSTVNICSPFDSWIEVSFTYACETVTYRLKVRLGSSFGLDGVYTGSTGGAKTLYSANNVQPGSYDINLENLNATYTWTRTIGSSTITLPTTTNSTSFGIVANQTVTFNVSTTSECCAFSRTFAFFAGGGDWLPANGNSKKDTFKVYPNPATDVVTINFQDMRSLSSQARTVGIIDPLGRLVRRLSGITDNSFQITLVDLPSGTYWLQINDGQQVQTVSIHKL